jgi:hypothetical protein
MAYDQGLAQRLREVLEEERGVTEKEMFGGIAFLLHGKRPRLRLLLRHPLQPLTCPRLRLDHLATHPQPHARLRHLPTRPCLHVPTPPRPLRLPRRRSCLATWRSPSSRSPTAIPLPASFPEEGAPAAAGPGAGEPSLSTEVFATIEAAAVQKIGPRAAGLAEAMAALPPEALRMLPPDALKALASM